MRPWMKESEIKALEKVFLFLAKKRNTLNILEWGSGGSTVYFTDFLKNLRIDYKWLSLEYNKDWYEEIQKLKADDTNTKIVLFDVDNNELKQRHTNMDAYVGYSATLGQKFDFILVDGRKRRRCILEAKKLLSDGGVVALHDAYRKYYHCAFKNFSYSRFLKISLWVGKNKQPNFWEKATNMIINKFYLFIQKARRL